MEKIELKINDEFVESLKELENFINNDEISLKKFELLIDYLKFRDEISFFEKGFSKNQQNNILSINKIDYLIKLKSLLKNMENGNFNQSISLLNNIIKEIENEN